MNHIYLVSYEVSGIKNLDDWVSLFFYNKTFIKDFDIRKYNVKAIYGTNGAGKSAIIGSVSILKSIILDAGYLRDPMVQKQLDDLINKKTKKLQFRVEFVFEFGKNMTLWRYEVRLEMNRADKYQITREVLSRKNAKSHSSDYETVFLSEKGILGFSQAYANHERVVDLTKNLLMDASFSAVLSERKDVLLQETQPDKLWVAVGLLVVFASNLIISMEIGDDHSGYYVLDQLAGADESSEPFDQKSLNLLFDQTAKLRPQMSGGFSDGYIIVEKQSFRYFKEDAGKLFEFLHIFKNDLKSVDINKKDMTDSYRCSLVMNYGDYSIDAEFESTGIKKLIRLYDCFDKMIRGKIVFIDDLDSNLHDVYLCALLEYLMENGEGQLCFTAHNIGPMDVLKKNRKSIEFLSTNHRVYSWKTNGNYSPSKLYRNGMIEGSPFNVFPFDFLPAFQRAEA